MTPAHERRMRRAATQVTWAIDHRNRLIVSAVNGGASLREVAALVGLSHTGVRNIVQRREEQ